MPIKRTIKDILSQYTVNSGGCWLWTKCADIHGYGRFRRDGKTWLPHRVSYEFHVGDVPADKYVLHTCDVPKCINPAHLYVGTQQDNMDDKTRRGRQAPGDRIRMIGNQYAKGKNIGNQYAKGSPGNTKVHHGGEKNGNAKLTDDMTHSAREMHLSGATSHNIAKLFGVCERTIRNVLKGRAWTHVKPAPVLFARDMFLFSAESNFGKCERNARVTL